MQTLPCSLITSFDKVMFSQRSVCLSDCMSVHIVLPHLVDSDADSSDAEWSVVESNSTTSVSSASRSLVTAPYLPACVDGLAAGRRSSPWLWSCEPASVGGAGGDPGGLSAAVWPRGLVGDTLADDDVEDRMSEPRDAGGDLLLAAARLLQRFQHSKIQLSRKLYLK